MEVEKLLRTPPNRAGVLHHTAIMSDSDTHRAHGTNGLGEGHLAEEPASREGHFLLKLLNMLFQISGAEKMYLKGYGLCSFKEEKYDLRD